MILMTLDNTLYVEWSKNIHHVLNLCLSLSAKKDINPMEKSCPGGGMRGGMNVAELKKMNQCNCTVGKKSTNLGK